MSQKDRDQFCTFFRLNRYDIIQAREGDGWGPIFTFSPCDVRAAQKAGQMMARRQQGEPRQVRHARRARLHDRHRHADTDVVVLTTFPERVQEVIGIKDAVILPVNVYLQDDALAALEAGLAGLLDGTVLPGP